jgi:hypothetical protein
MNNIIEKYTEKKAQEYSQKIDEFLQSCVESDLVKPKVVGQITKGKLRWRGIYLQSEQTDKGTLYKVFQRETHLGSMLIV